jgi:hypothetical protein
MLTIASPNPNVARVSAPTNTARTTSGTTSTVRTLVNAPVEVVRRTDVVVAR